MVKKKVVELKKPTKFFRRRLSTFFRSIKKKKDSLNYGGGYPPTMLTKRGPYVYGRTNNLFSNPVRI